MEAVRPVVDSYVLALLTQRTLARRDFIETRQGSCRLTPHLAADLVATCTAWRQHVAPVVENIGHALARPVQPAAVYRAGFEAARTPPTREPFWHGRATIPTRRFSSRRFFPTSVELRSVIW